MAEVLHLYIFVLKFTFLQPLASASECSLPWSDIWQILTVSFVAIEGSMSVWKVSVFSMTSQMFPFPISPPSAQHYNQLIFLLAC